MKLTLSLHTSRDMSTKEDMSRMLRTVADRIDDAPCDRLEANLCDADGYRVGHLSITGAVALPGSQH